MDDLAVFLAMVSLHRYLNLTRTSFPQALSILTTVFNVLTTRAGFGRHVHDLSLPQLSLAVKYIILSETAIALSLAFSKISICLFFLGILNNSFAKKRQWFLYLTICLLLVTAAISVGQQLGQCQPAYKLWRPEVPGTCDNPNIQTKVSYFNGGMCTYEQHLEILKISY